MNKTIGKIKPSLIGLPKNSEIFNLRIAVVKRLYWSVKEKGCKPLI